MLAGLQCGDTAIPCQGGFPSPPPPPTMPASTELCSPCWTPDTAELFYEHQQPKDQNLSFPQQACGEKILFPFVPCLLGWDSSGFFALIARHKAEGEGKEEVQQRVKEAQEQPGPPWCTSVPPEFIFLHVHMGQKGAPIQKVTWWKGGGNVKTSLLCVMLKVAELKDGWEKSLNGNLRHGTCFSCQKSG